MKTPFRLICVLFITSGIVLGQTASPTVAKTEQELSASETPIPLHEYSALVKANPNDDLKAARSANRPDLIPLAAALAQVQTALDKYRGLPGAKTLPPLESAEFEFKVTKQFVIGAKLSLWIITIGGSRTTQDVNGLKFTYSAPKATPTPTPKPSAQLTARGQTLQENLVNTIQQAALVAKNDFTWGGKNYTKQIEVKLEYGVDVKFEGGLQIPVYTLTVGPNASWDKNAVQSVTLTFGTAK